MISQICLNPSHTKGAKTQKGSLFWSKMTFFSCLNHNSFLHEPPCLKWCIVRAVGAMEKQAGRNLDLLSESKVPLTPASVGSCLLLPSSFVPHLLPPISLLLWFLLSWAPCKLGQCTSVLSWIETPCSVQPLPSPPSKPPQQVPFRSAWQSQVLRPAPNTHVKTRSGCLRPFWIISSAASKNNFFLSLHPWRS